MDARCICMGTAAGVSSENKTEGSLLAEVSWSEGKTVSMCSRKGKGTTTASGKRGNVCSLSCCLVTKLCLTLCNPMDCSSPGSSVHGII